MEEANLPLGMEDLTGTALSNNKYISLRIFCAELFGTALFIYFGNAATAQVIIGKYDLNKTITEERLNPAVFDYGDAFTIACAYGMGLTLAVCACGAVSGSHLNPAVTLTEVLFRRLPATVLPVYGIAQFFGVFIGTGFVHTVHSFKLNKMVEDEVNVETVYYTLPTLGMEYDVVTLAWDQTLGSAIYMFVYLSMDDRYTGIKSKPIRAIVIGTSYSLLILSTGVNGGTALNPVRDLVPRIFAYLVGHNKAFDYYFAIPLFMPFIGCFLGGVIYEACVRSLRQEDEMMPESTTMDDILMILANIEKHIRGFKSKMTEDGSSLQGGTTSMAADETTETLTTGPTQKTAGTSSKPASRKKSSMRSLRGASAADIMSVKSAKRRSSFHSAESRVDSEEEKSKDNRRSNKKTPSIYKTRVTRNEDE